MSTREIDDDLNRLESDIRQLKIQYEQYFGGGKKRPPSDVEWRIETVMKRYGDRGGEMNFSQRFRYGNLIQTYVKYREIFHKRLQSREEGSVQRHFGAAARAIQAARVSSGNEPFSAPVVVACSEPTRETQKVDQLYEAFRSALERVGETNSQLSRSTFQWFLQQKADQFSKENGRGDIEFVVSVEAGKARLKARVKS